MKRQITDADNQRKRLLDAYEAGVIELNELVSRRNAIDNKIERAKMNLNDLYVANREDMPASKLKKNIEEVCKSLSNGLRHMDMERKMSLCKDLIEKVVVERHNVEIHYKFPVSSNFNKRTECPAFHCNLFYCTILSSSLQRTFRLNINILAILWIACRQSFETTRGRLAYYYGLYSSRSRGKDCCKQQVPEKMAASISSAGEPDQKKN